jgi:hypothetical protein
MPALLQQEDLLLGSRVEPIPGHVFDCSFGLGHLAWDQTPISDECGPSSGTFTSTWCSSPSTSAGLIGTELIGAVVRQRAPPLGIEPVAWSVMTRHRPRGKPDPAKTQPPASTSESRHGRQHPNPGLAAPRAPGHAGRRNPQRLAGMAAMPARHHAQLVEDPVLLARSACWYRVAIVSVTAPVRRPGLTVSH